MRASAVAVAVSLAIVGLSFADSASAVARRMTVIPAQELSLALRELAREHQISVLARSELVRDLRTAGAVGEFTIDEALGKLLSGTALTFQYLDEKTIAIVPLSAGSSIGAGSYDSIRDVYLADVSMETSVPEVKSSETSSETVAPAQSAKKTELEEILVTGSHIRGGSAPSPMIAIGSGQIKEEGFTDLGEVVRSVPQNFTGGQNPGVFSLGLSGGGLQNQNLTGGSTLNLRGLGPDATLTLLNGRRLAYGGFSQTVDISAIPVEAVEQIQIVADGASAIYGSDAVGGVGNVILKRDFDGITLGTRHGAATDGGLVTHEYTGTAGITWSSGGVIATYQNTSVDPIYAKQRDYSDFLVNPTTIYPGSDLDSGLLSVHQSFGGTVELRLDALRTNRDQVYDSVIYGQNYHVESTTTTEFVSPTIEFTLPGEWSLSAAGTWGRDKHFQVQSTQILLTGVSTPQSDDCVCNESRSYEIGAEGPLFKLAGDDVRLAVGAGYRRNDFHLLNRLTNVTAIRGSESSRFAYGEINLPLLDSASVGGAKHRVVATAAVRSEDYESYGKVTTPKLGLIYSPGDDTTLKASWGKSFKMPTLFQLHRGQVVGLVPPPIYGGSGFPADAAVLALGGGNPDLKPERATTWTGSLAFHPGVLPGLNMELTWFDISYTERVVEPIANPSEALSNPVYAQFVTFTPTDEEKARVVSTGQFLNYMGVPYDPEKVVAIMYDQYLNVSSQHIKGLDLSGAYTFDVDSGQLTFRGSVSWLDSSQQVSDSDRMRALAGTLFNPARIAGRMGATYRNGGLSLSVFANYKGGVTNTADAKKSASFTTLDSALRYSVGVRKDLWSETDLAVSIQNLLDRSPPLFTPATMYVAPYDSTNYSAIGRFVSVSLSKHW